jgi:hypothetical protein
MLKKSTLISSLILSTYIAGAQTTFLPLGTENYHTLDRLETMSGRLSDTLRLSAKPESRRNAVRFLESISNDSGSMKVSAIDRYNMEQMISESGEWASEENGAIRSKHSLFNAFYKTQYNLGYVKTDNFFLVINPVMNTVVLAQQNNPSVDAGFSAIPGQTYFSSRGAEIRGWIAKKIGFYTSFTDNQEKFPYPVYNYVTRKYEAIPGADYFKRPLNKFGAYDYFQASGYINFDAVKNHVNITAGFGKHFIGDGMSSILLTDNSSNMPFVRLQGRIWKLNYECLYLELTPQYVKTKDQTIGHKYSTMHYLTWNATPWLNLGLFEAQVFNRRDRYEFSYMNPIIFSTAMSRYNGAGDKSLIGLTGKIIFARHFQLYGQAALNEFKIGELLGGRGWYGNKWAIQAGGKYFNAFGINNLDLQGEIDAVRPYTYSAQDTIANYTNYNQPLADPLGSGFVKAIGFIQYQPVKNLYVSAKATFYRRGVDTGSKNYGNNIFKNYPSKSTEYGVAIINGPEARCQMLNLNVSYQIRRNIFFDLGGTYRKFESDVAATSVSSTTGTTVPTFSTTSFYLGLRINAPRRDYDIF